MKVRQYKTFRFRISDEDIQSYRIDIIKNKVTSKIVYDLLGSCYMFNTSSEDWTDLASFYNSYTTIRMLWERGVKKKSLIVTGSEAFNMVEILCLTEDIPAFTSYMNRLFKYSDNFILVNNDKEFEEIIKGYDLK